MIYIKEVTIQIFRNQGLVAYFNQMGSFILVILKKGSIKGWVDYSEKQRNSFWAILRKEN